MTAPPLNPALFHLDEAHLWVMHCAEGPVPRAAMRVVRAFMHKELQPWAMGFEEDFVGLPRALRAEAATLLGGRAEDVTLTPTTSSGLVAVAQGFPWQAGDEVLAPLGEFPSNSWPWLALGSRGVSFREVPIWEGHRAGAEAWASAAPGPDSDPEGRLIAALEPHTRILSVSWVRFQDGLKLDLQRLGAACQERGVALVVDGIQGLGTAAMNLEGVSALASGGYKGLLAPEGLGLLWTEPEFRARLTPTGSWLSVEQATDFGRPSTDLQRDWLTDGRALEPGGPNLLHTAALLESLRLLNDTGIAAIEAHVARLQGHLLDALQATPWVSEVARLRALGASGRLGSILAFHHGERGPEGLERLLRSGYRQGIFASVREGYLRIAFHGFHTEGDVARVATWLSGTAN